MREKNSPISYQFRFTRVLVYMCHVHRTECNKAACSANPKHCRCVQHCVFPLCWFEWVEFIGCHILFSCRSAFAYVHHICSFSTERVWGLKPQHAVLALVSNACFTLSLPSPISLHLLVLLPPPLFLLLCRTSCCTSFSHYLVTHSHTYTHAHPQSPINHLGDSHTHGGFYPTCQSISEV